jgi:hypothetical protein
MTERSQISSYHDLSVEQLLEMLAVDRSHGLSGRDIDRLIERYGPNKLHQAKRRSAWEGLGVRCQSSRRPEKRPV